MKILFRAFLLLLPFTMFSQCLTNEINTPLFNNQVLAVSPNNYFFTVSRVGGNVRCFDFSGNPYPFNFGTSFSNATGVKVNSQGEVFVLENGVANSNASTTNATVKVFAANGGLIKSITLNHAGYELATDDNNQFYVFRQASTNSNSTVECYVYKYDNCTNGGCLVKQFTLANINNSTFVPKAYDVSQNGTIYMGVYDGQAYVKVFNNNGIFLRNINLSVFLNFLGICVKEGTNRIYVAALNNTNNDGGIYTFDLNGNYLSHFSTPHPVSPASNVPFFSVDTKGPYLLASPRNVSKIYQLNKAVNIISKTPSTSSINKCLASSTTFSVGAEGLNLTYQWRKDGTNISGATTNSLTLNNIQASDAGSYDCVVTGTCGSATSSATTLNVSTPATYVTPYGTYISGMGSTMFLTSSDNTTGTSSWLDISNYWVQRATTPTNASSVFVSGYYGNRNYYVSSYFAGCDQTISQYYYLGNSARVGEDGVLIEDGEIGLYPNPATEVIFLGGLSSEDQLTVSNNNGAIVIDKKDNRDGRIDVSALAPGIYTLRIMSTGKVTYKKFQVIK